MKKLFLVTYFISLSLFAKSSIVLIPGAGSSGDQISVRNLTPVFGPIKEGEYFKHLKKKLTKSGYRVFVCPKIRDNDSRTLGHRSLDCQTYLVKLKLKKPKLKFHLVAHSMGGLVARKMVENYFFAGIIKSITTISFTRLCCKCKPY